MNKHDPPTHSSQLPGNRSVLFGPGPDDDVIAAMDESAYAEALSSAAALWPQVLHARAQCQEWGHVEDNLLRQHDYFLIMARGYEKRMGPHYTRQLRRAASATHYTPTEWEAVLAVCHHTCLCCGRTEPDVTLVADHVRPLSDTSAPPDDSIANIQPLCTQCNARKGTRTIDYRPGHACAEKEHK